MRNINECLHEIKNITDDMHERFKNPGFIPRIHKLKDIPFQLDEVIADLEVGFRAQGDELMALRKRLHVFESAIERACRINNEIKEQTH